MDRSLHWEKIRSEILHSDEFKTPPSHHVLSCLLILLWFHFRPHNRIVLDPNARIMGFSLALRYSVPLRLGYRPRVKERIVLEKDTRPPFSISGNSSSTPKGESGHSSSFPLATGVLGSPSARVGRSLHCDTKRARQTCLSWRATPHAFGVCVSDKRDPRPLPC
jgi:hypothetical protein